MKKVFLTCRDTLIALVILFLSEMIGMMFSSAVSSLFNGTMLRDYVYVVLNTGMYILAAVFLLNMYTKKLLHLEGNGYINRPMNWHSALRWIVFILVIQSCIIILTAIIFPGKWSVCTNFNMLNLFRAFVNFGIGAGIIEEVIFRGFLLSEYEKKFGRRLAVVFTSGLFALLHIVNIKNTIELILTVLYTFLLAVLLSILMYRTQNLWCCIICHGVWNFIFMGCITISMQDNSTAIIQYITGSEYYLAISVVVILGACILSWGANKKHKCVEI